MAFALDQRLGGSHLAVTLNQIQVRLADDSRYFWVILVPASPMVNNISVSEIHDLPAPVAAIYGHFPSDQQMVARPYLADKLMSRHLAMWSASFIFMWWRARSDPA